MIVPVLNYSWFNKIDAYLFKKKKRKMYIIIGERHHQSRFSAWDRVLRVGALGWPWGMRWEGRWKGNSGWGTHVHLWLIHVNIWQKPLQYCKVIQFSSVQSLSRVQLFVTLWIAARQASLSITNSWSLPKLMSIESVMPSSLSLQLK